MRPALAGALVAVVLLLGGAPAADAGGSVTLVDVPGFVGPVLAGDDVMWATEAADGTEYVVERLTPDGSRSVVGRVPAPDGVRATFVGSSDRVALSLFRESCFRPSFCDTIDDQGVDFHVLATGPPGGPIVSVENCRGFEGCAQSACPIAVDADGDALSIRERDCRGERDYVRDYAAGGAEHTLPVDESDSIEHRTRWSLAGPYAASSQKIIEWRSGRVVVEVPGYRGVVIEPGGRYAFSIESGKKTSTAWASVSDPTVRTLGPPIRDHAVQAIAGDAVARTRGTLVEVLGLDGSLRASTRVVNYADGLRFDGRRLVWGTGLCGYQAVVTWDLEGRPPALPVGGCPLPRIERRVLRLQPGNRLELPLSCPAEPALGCWGYVELRGWPRGEIAYLPSYMRPGEKQTLRARVPRRALCKADRRGRGRVRVSIEVAVRSQGEEERYVDRTLPLDGIPSDARPCRR